MQMTESLCDYELESVAWNEGGRDLVVRLRAPSAEPTRASTSVTCRWAENVEISLRTSEGRGGYFLTWATTVEVLSDGRSRVRFDFGSSGAVQLTCVDVDVA
jgi:hypothetical protein